MQFTDSTILPESEFISLSQTKVLQQPHTHFMESIQEMAVSTSSKLMRTNESRTAKPINQQKMVLGPNSSKVLGPRAEVPDKPNFDAKDNNLTDGVENLNISQGLEFLTDLTENVTLRPNWNLDLFEVLNSATRTTQCTNTNDQEFTCSDLLKDVQFDEYLYGQTVHGTPKAMVQLAMDSKIDNLKTGHHGVFTDKDLSFLMTDPKLADQQMNEKIGESSHGIVHLLQHSDKLLVKKKVLNNFRPAEVINMQRLDHKNIVKISAFLMNEGVPEILMEYGGRSLHTYAKERQMSEVEIWDVTKQMLTGLVHVHDLGVIHMDFKPENTFITTSETSVCVKIGDFGSSKLADEEAKIEGMTPEYLPTEASRLFLKKHYPQLVEFPVSEHDELSISSKCDVYQAGLTVLFMYKQYHVLLHHFKTQFPQLEGGHLRLLMLRQVAHNENLAKKLIPPEIGDQMKCILLNMLHGDVTKRFLSKKTLELMRIFESLRQNVGGQPGDSGTSSEQKITDHRSGIAVEPTRVPREKVIHPRRGSKGTKYKTNMKTKDKEESLDDSLTLKNEKILHEPPQLRKRMVKQQLKRRLEERQAPVPHKNIKTCSGAVDSVDADTLCSIADISSPWPQDGTSGISMDIPYVNMASQLAYPIQAMDDLRIISPIQETIGNMPNFDLLD